MTPDRPPIRYIVRGAHRDTGEEVEIIIAAKTPSDAEDKALKLGILITEIDIEPPPTLPVVTMEDHLPLHQRTHPEPGRKPPLPPLPRKKPPSRFIDPAYTEDPTFADHTSVRRDGTRDLHPDELMPPHQRARQRPADYEKSKNTLKRGMLISAIVVAVGFAHSCIFPPTAVMMMGWGSLAFVVFFILYLCRK